MSHAPKRLLSYVVASDNGLAPNITGGFCTLAVCKPLVRRTAVAGDLIVGVSTSRHGHDRVIYAMEVNERVPYATYFNDPRFQSKKPGPANARGDNFFTLKNGTLQVAYTAAAHAGRADKIERDLNAPVVLVGEKFWYFGGAAPRLPAHLSDTAIAVPGENGRRGHRVTSDRALINIFMDWINAYRPGIHGVPRDIAPQP